MELKTGDSFPGYTCRPGSVASAVAILGAEVDWKCFQPVFIIAFFFSIHVHVGDDEGRTMQQPGDHRSDPKVCVEGVRVCAPCSVLCRDDCYEFRRR